VIIKDVQKCLFHNYCMLPYVNTSNLLLGCSDTLATLAGQAGMIAATKSTLIVGDKRAQSLHVTLDLH
jgi:hypothetical protein